MLVAKVAFPVLLFMSLAEARYYSHLSRVLRSTNDRFSISERRNNGYLQQCDVVNTWREHLGYVSVLAFLDPAWQYSFRQAIMLEMLSRRLRKSGFLDIRFFVIHPASDSPIEWSDENFEIETWREIGAKSAMESFVDLEPLKDNRSSMTILWDNPQSRIWQTFRASRDQVIVIDRCGKLTYHVIVPWSILFFPYVKAAILSTYEEDPCGGCDPFAYRLPNREERIVKLAKPIDGEETNPKSRTDVNFDGIWTTENLENIDIHRELSEKEIETTPVSSSLFKEITDDTNCSIVLTKFPTTESTTYYPDVEGIWDQENSKSSKDNGNVTSESHSSSNNRSLIREQFEIINNSRIEDKEMTMSDFVDEIQDKNATLENIENFEKNAFPQLRIIMYAPHSHKTGRETKKYTHLILKTGDPSFHGHLDYVDVDVDVASPTNSQRVSSESHVIGSKEYDWKTTRAKANKENVDTNYTFDKDESPGLYGEVSDYWKSYEDGDVNDKNETISDTTYNDTTTSCNEDYRNNVSSNTTSPSKLEEKEHYPFVNVTEDPCIESSINLNIIDSKTIGSSKSVDTYNKVEKKEEREMQYKLIQHYKKLLSWIDYRLSK